MRLVLISPEGERADEAALLSTFVERGLTRYHVRKPHWSQERLEAWLALLSAQVRSRCVVHSGHALVDRHGLLGRHWRDEAGVDAIAEAGFTSRSCHTVEALQAAFGRFTAVFFSPVFASLSKPGHGGASEPVEVSALLRARTPGERTTEVLALGGVTPARVSTCAAWGFDGVAVLGAVWLAPEPMTAFAALQQAIQEVAA